MTWWQWLLVVLGCWCVLSAVFIAFWMRSTARLNRTRDIKSESNEPADDDKTRIA